jgi:tetratricopeptide (TPR) repeat protein
VAERLLSLFARQGRFDEARTLLERVRRTGAPGRWSDYAVSLAIQSGEFPSAISELELRLAGDNIRPEDLIKMANLVYIERQDAAGALAYLDRARMLAPDSLDCVAIRALILKEEGRLGEAQQLVDEFAHRKNDFASQLLRATFYRSTNNGRQATSVFELLPDLSPDGTGYALLGEYHAHAGRLSDAIAVWEQGLESFPEDTRLRRGIAKALVIRCSPGDHERAESLLLELRRDQPHDGETAWVLAELKLGEGTEQSVEEGLDLLLEAIELSPYRVELYLRALPLLLDRREFAQAEELAARAQTIHPRDVQLLLGHAMVKLAVEDFATARELARRALELQPDSVQAVATLAEIGSRSGDFDLLRDIGAQVAQAVERRPETTWLQVSHAIALVLDGQRDAALVLEPEVLVMAAGVFATSGEALLQDHAHSLYEHVIKSAPRNVAAHMGLATLAFLRGDVENAIYGYRAALELEPSNVDALNNLGWALAQKRSAERSVLEEALRHASEAVRLKPHDPNLRDTRGVILSKLGRLQEAQAEYVQYVELTEPGTPIRAKALLQLGRTCALLDDKSETRRCLQQALEIDRQHDVFTPQERGEIGNLLEQADVG